MPCLVFCQHGMERRTNFSHIFEFQWKRVGKVEKKKSVLSPVASCEKSSMEGCRVRKRVPLIQVAILEV